MILKHFVFVVTLYFGVFGLTRAQEATIVLYAHDEEQKFEVSPHELFTKVLLNHRGSDTLLLINRGAEDIRWYSQQSFGWLYPEKAQGTLKAGETYYLPLHIHTESLPLAIYSDTLYFKNQKTYQTMAMVPVEVMIEAKPKISVPVNYFSTALFTNEHKQLMFSVKNEGNTALDYSIYTDVSVAWLQTILPTQGTLAPGESREHTLLVNGEGIENGIYEGVAWISSNDPNQPRTFMQVNMKMSTEQAALVYELNKSGLCRDESFDIPYEFKGLTLGRGNKIIAELSDPNGQFKKAWVIGEKRSTNTTGTLGVHIPKQLPVGTGYKIRLRGTDPKLISIDLGNSFSVGAPIDLQFANIASVCDTEDDFILDQASPVGGNYSGVGVSEGTFSPRLAGAGKHLLTYQLRTEFGCTAQISREVLVRASPKISHPPVSQICTGSQPFTLSGGRPAGGFYRGNGIEASGLVVPAELKPGTQSFTYIVEQTACRSEVKVSYQVAASPAKPQLTQAGELLVAEKGTLEYVWFNNGKVINNQNQQTLKPKAYGLYKLAVKNEAGCETLSDPINFEAPDIAQDIWNSLEIGPNPASNHLFIQGEIEGSTHPSRINMVFADSEGRSMIEASYGNIKGKFKRRVDWTGLKPGIYEIRLEWEGKNFQKKVIVSE